MRDLLDILAAAAALAAAGEPATLATVVRVQGSSYRLPGARMLIDAAGRRVGSVSGGCLEADVARRGRVLTADRPTTLARYDAAELNAVGDDLADDVAWGFNLGCNGSVEILIERLPPDAEAAGLGFVRRCVDGRRPGALVHVFRGTPAVPPGTRAAAVPDLESLRVVTDPRDLFAHLDGLRADVATVLATGGSLTAAYDTPAGPVHALVEAVRPPTPLVIFGGGHDALPLVRAAKALGWHVTVCDRRAGHARPDRFPEADAVIAASAADVPTRVPLSADTAAVVMTHHYPEDRDLLGLLLPSAVRYVGALGPRERTDRMLAEIAWPYTDAQLARLHAPVGLDLGGDGAEAIAVAVVAEVLAALNNRTGGPLRHRPGPIHTPAQTRG